MSVEVVLAITDAKERSEGSWSREFNMDQTDSLREIYIDYVRCQSPAADAASKNSRRSDGRSLARRAWVWCVV